MTYQCILILILSLLYCGYTTSVDAVERIEVPDTFPPHPRLFMDQGEIDQLKAWAATETWAKKRIDGFISYNLQDAKKDYTPGRSSNSNIARKAQYMAFAYALSGEERLAQKVAEILLAYADVYPSYPTTGSKGRATESTLREAPWAINIATAYDFIYNSGALSDDDKVRIESDVLRPCAEVLRICGHRTKGNWRSWAFAGFGVIGFCIGEQEYIEEALNGYRDPTGKLTRYGFAQQIAESVLADGIFFERALGYHFYTLSAYVQLAEAARHSGVDLWHTEITGNEQDAGADVNRLWGDTGKKTMKMMFDAPFYYIFPDLSGAAVADSHTFHLRANTQYELAYRAYKDEKYAWLLNQVEQPRRPRYDIGLMWFSPEVPPGKFDLKDNAGFGLRGMHQSNCTVFPSTGYAILREDTTKDATCVLMSYGKYGTGHDHPDKLHISIYSQGKIIAPDPGTLGYGNREHLTWANQTIAHNTVTVDETAQYPQGTRDSIWAADSAGKPSIGELVFFRTGKHLKAVRADCDNAYEGVTLSRTVAIVDSRVFDIYRVRSRSEHQYDYALHVDGELTNSSLKLEKQSGALSPKRGYAHITDIQRGQMTQEDCNLTYAVSEGNSLRLTILPVPDGEVILGRGLEIKDERKPVVIVRTKATDADFVVIMTLGSSPDVNVKRLDGMPDGVIALEIDRADGGKDYLVSMERWQKKISIAGTEIEGKYGSLLSLVRVDADGNVTSVELTKRSS